MCVKGSSSVADSPAAQSTAGKVFPTVTIVAH